MGLMSVAKVTPVLVEAGGREPAVAVVLGSSARAASVMATAATTVARDSFSMFFMVKSLSLNRQFQSKTPEPAESFKQKNSFAHLGRSLAKLPG
jgi:hypothetical protein